MDEQGHAGRDGTGRAGADPGAVPQVRPDVDIDADTVTTTVLAVPERSGGNPGAMPLDAQPQAMAAGAAGDDQPHFPVVLRGYERTHVDAAVADLRARLDAAVARYETAEAALSAARAAAADGQRRTEQAQHDVAALRQQVQEVARSAEQSRAAPVVVSERLRQVLELAEAEAAEIRRNARRDAEQATVDMRAEIERLSRRRAELDAELGRLHARITALLAGGDSA
ncbi:MAG: hypothetical protein ACJ74O_13205 [Frankiaceae bacterium]